MEIHAQPKSRFQVRRFLRFSLRGLLVVVAVVSVCLGVAFHRAREQARAVAAIESAGGHVFYDYHGTDYDLDQSASSGIPAWLLDALGVDFFHNVTVVSFYRIDTTDREFAAVTALPEIRMLSVVGRITNAALKPLKQLKKLQFLAILSGEITDAGLAELQDLKQLQHLGIHGPTKFDMLFSKHRRDPNAVYGANITDRGLEALKSLPALRTLRLDNTKVTRIGAQRLSQSLPDCVILVNQGRERVFYVKPHPPPPGW